MLALDIIVFIQVARGRMLATPGIYKVYIKYL